MTERIITDSNGRKHITNEPQLHPPQRPWVGLTFAEICECESEYANVFARNLEAKLKEKNT